MESLASDLRSFGWEVRVQFRNGQIHFRAALLQQTNKAAIAQLKAIRNRRLASEASFIRRMERWGVGSSFASGKNLQLGQIRPRLHICRTRQENDVFHYCRLLQSFPTANLIGRQIRALVFDEGQDRPVLIGAIGLSSSPYSLSCRDAFLRWNSKHERLRLHRGLDSLMQLAVCMALPPYSYLLAGKLMAALALSKTIADEYQFKYKGRCRRRAARLLGLVTICAGGTHCPIFNRIMLRPGGLYRRVGETTGYTTAFLSQRTMDCARLLVRSSNRDDKIFGKSLRLIKSALRACGLPYEGIVRNGLRKGVYLGFASPQALANLRSGETQKAIPALTEMQIIDHWQNRILPFRLSRADVKQKVRRFDAQALLLSTQINPRATRNGKAIR